MFKRFDILVSWKRLIPVGGPPMLEGVKRDTHFMFDEYCEPLENGRAWCYLVGIQSGLYYCEPAYVFWYERRRVLTETTIRHGSEF